MLHEFSSHCSGGREPHPLAPAESLSREEGFGSVVECGPNTENAAPDVLAHWLHRSSSRRRSWDPADVAEEVGCTRQEAEQAVGYLRRTGLLVADPLRPSGFRTVSPDNALMSLLSLEDQLTEAWERERSRRHRHMMSLIQQFSLGAGASGEVDVQVIPDALSLGDLIEESVLQSRVRTRTMHAKGAPSADAFDGMALRDVAVLNQGVRVRVLCARHVADDPRVADYLAEISHYGADVRTTEALPLRMVLVDDDLAILPVDRRGAARGGLAIRNRMITETLDAIFDFHWSAALPSAHAVEESAGRELLSPWEKTVVRMMAAGAKDEAIARELGISTRTLSRKVSQMFDRLNVQSRFQAAIELSRLGVLDPTGEGIGTC
ncbi:LuxR C-terminal-related transcriptional regulator [Streptomyces sp. ODS05-4]|uniref:helix-turn-helix transcriptional regulator n=1 Tax=Streptomyces sp. ODS05-4 TaxID=2944939 RepID=UPI00210BB635|nr:LuxR C-terminal-related transcriptional regulator [Streptomyces sp. ODS05-4]